MSAEIESEAVKHGLPRDVTRRAPITIMLLILTLFPTLIFYLKFAPSLTAGSAAASGMVIALAAGFPSLLRKSLFRGSLLFVPIAAGIGLHICFAGLFLDIDYGRAAASLLPLMAVLVGGITFANVLAESENAQVTRAVRICFVLFCLLAAMSIAGVKILPASYDKPVFPFSEPSIFALGFASLLMATCVMTQGYTRALIVLIGLVIALLLQNLTLLVGLLIITFVCIRGFVLPLAAMALVGAASLLDLSYYTQRLNFGVQSNNLSALVYIQGWQLLLDGLKTSWGWGIGFQQLGVHGVHTEISNTIFAILDNNANILDGGFVLAKLGSEFGIFGLLIVLSLLIYAAICARRLSKQVNKKAHYGSAQIFAFSVLATYPVELLVRGVGYFTSTAALLVAALYILFTVKPAQLPATQHGVPGALQDDGSANQPATAR